MFKGVITAIVTPFTRNNEIDEKVLRKLVRFQLENGVAGILPVGTTGESPTLSFDEHCRVIQIVIDEVAGQIPVIAGTGSNCTEEAIKLTAFAKKVKATASLQVTPYYNRPTDEGLIAHFTSIANAVDLPMIVYNIPGRTGKNIENSVMLELAKHQNIVGVKEASGNIPQVMELIQSVRPDFVVLSGDDNLTLPLMALGAKGVISVASNIVPRKMTDLVNLMLENNFGQARELHYQLLPFFKALFIETNPIPIKASLAMKGMIEESYRLPLCPLKQANREKLQKVLRDCQII